MVHQLRQCGAEVCKISDDILDTVRQHQHEPDVPGIPAMRYHDAMLGCQRKLDEAFHNVKHFMAQQQRQLDDHRLLVQNGKGAEYGDDEQWGTDKEQSFHGPDTKRSRRGVSVSRCIWRGSLTNEFSSELRPQGAAIAATEPRRRNGVEGRTVLARCVMPVDCTMPN